MPVRQFETPEPPRLGDDLLEVGGGALGAPRAGVAGADDAVGPAVHGEGLDAELAGKDGRVGERLEVARAIPVAPATWRRGQSRRGREPFRRQREAHVVGPLDGFHECDECGRAVEHAVVGTDPIGRHRAFVAAQRVGNREARRGADGQADAPAVLADGLDRNLVPGVARGDGLHARGVILDAVEPRRPDGHHQVDAAPALDREDGVDLREMRGGIGDGDRVDDRLEVRRPPVMGKQQDPEHETEEPSAHYLPAAPPSGARRSCPPSSMLSFALKTITWSAPWLPPSTTSWPIARRALIVSAEKP